MKRSTGILHIALAALYACAPSLAVVHGIQPALSAHFESTAANRNGYRYNGPAHKYLPAASELTTSAVTTTGHWEPNPVQSPPEQQLPHEHSFGSRRQTGYNGPYSMQYYEQAPAGDSWQQQQQDSRQQQQQQLSTFQYAANHQAAAGAAAGGQPGQAQHLYAGAQHDRRLESGQRGAQLIGQALPERYQRQPFAVPQPERDGVNFVQMQSNSFELPPTYSMHGPWPEQVHKQQQDFEYAAQGQFHGHAQFEQQFQLQHQQQQLEYPQSSILQVHVHSPSTQTAYLPPPSREFQAPYY